MDRSTDRTISPPASLPASSGLAANLYTIHGDTTTDVQLPHFRCHRGVDSATYSPDAKVMVFEQAPLTAAFPRIHHEREWERPAPPHSQPQLRDASRLVSRTPSRQLLSAIAALAGTPRVLWRWCRTATFRSSLLLPMRRGRVFDEINEARGARAADDPRDYRGQRTWLRTWRSRVSERMGLLW
jgi:hypothetical protein